MANESGGGSGKVVLVVLVLMVLLCGGCGLLTAFLAIAPGIVSFLTLGA